MEYEKCLNCNGSGEDSVFYTGGGVTRQFTFTCTYCRGKGYVIKEINKEYKTNHEWLERDSKS